MLFILFGCTGNNTENDAIEDTNPVIQTVFCSDIEVGDTLEVDESFIRNKTEKD